MAEKNTELLTFSNEEFGEIRAITIDGELWFLGKDVAVALGYSNTAKAIRDYVDDDDRTVNESFTVNGISPVLINESGLYSLVFFSKLFSATTTRFINWVTHEVFPHE